MTRKDVRKEVGVSWTLEGKKVLPRLDGEPRFVAQESWRGRAQDRHTPLKVTPLPFLALALGLPFQFLFLCSGFLSAKVLSE